MAHAGDIIVVIHEVMQSCGGENGACLQCFIESKSWQRQSGKGTRNPGVDEPC